jgi:hypothetical protein
METLIANIPLVAEMCMVISIVAVILYLKADVMRERTVVL